MAGVRYVVACLLMACVTDGVDQTCHFPESWGSNYWLTHRIVDESLPKDSLALLRYDEVNAYTATSLSPLTYTETYSCPAYETNADKQTFVRQTSGQTTCVEEQLLADYNIISHKETNQLQDGAELTLENCKAALEQESLLFLYLPVEQSPRPVLDTQLNTPCPFDNIPYRMYYRYETDGQIMEECTGDRSSVLTVSGDKINILGCKYQDFPTIPLTGQLHCLANIMPTDIGEEDATNGGILLLKWVTATQDEDLLYCTRYMVHPNRDIDMSIDLTSDSHLGCQMDSNYTSIGQHNGRMYVQFKFNFDASLVTASVTPNQMTPTRPPHVVSTDIPKQPDINMQVTLDKKYSTIESKPGFTATMKAELLQFAGVNPERIPFVEVTPGVDDNAVVTFTLMDDGFVPSMTTVNNKMEGELTMLGGHNVKADSFYSWRVTDPCQAEQCQDGECQVMQGVYKCECPDGYDGEYCKHEIEAGVASKSDNKRTITIIIIVVCVVVGVALITGIVVFIIIRQRGAKKKETAMAMDGESNAGYSTTMEDRDREMYSTINKKPKAFHEKSFTNLDENDDHGELTGIHM